jgi:hypothetical protein
MSDRLWQAALLAVLALACGACGAGSSSSSAPASSSPASPTTSATLTVRSSTRAAARVRPTTSTAAATSSTRTTSHRAASTPAATTLATTSRAATATRTTTTTSASTATAPASARTAPPPTPSGTPASPAGLSRTAGYGTYELCASGCSGSVPTALRRPLALPHVSVAGRCPVTEGRGPVKPRGPTQLAVSPLIGSSWRGGRVTWASAPSYTGPVLIRGRQLGGPGAVGFGEGRVPYDELQLLASGTGAPRPAGGGRAWLSFTRVRSAGCYAYQVDGTNFSSVAVFRATG